MIRYEDNCTGCSTIFGSCRGASCPNRNVPVLVCDDCGSEVETLYDYDGDQVCAECLLGRVPQVEV